MSTDYIDYYEGPARAREDDPTRGGRGPVMLGLDDQSGVVLTPRPGSRRRAWAPDVRADRALVTALSTLNELIAATEAPEEVATHARILVREALKRPGECNGPLSTRALAAAALARAYAVNARPYDVKRLAALTGVRVGLVYKCLWRVGHLDSLGRPGWMENALVYLERAASALGKPYLATVAVPILEAFRRMGRGLPKTAAATAAWVAIHLETGRDESMREAARRIASALSLNPGTIRKWTSKLLNNYDIEVYLE